MELEQSDLKEEITRFRGWEAQLPAADRVGLWDEYPAWGALSTAFEGFIKETDPAQWGESTVSDLLYLMEWGWMDILRG